MINWTTKSSCILPGKEDSKGFIKLSLGAFIICGLIISYLPQYIKIISEKSSYGISKLFLLLGFLGASSTLGNLLILQSHSLRCCFSEYTFLVCVQDTLGISQILLQFSLFSTLVALFVIYSKPFPNNHPSISSSSSGQVEEEYSRQIEDEYSQQQEQNQTETKLILRFMIAWFLILSIMVSVMMFENSIDASTKEWWAGVLGFVSAVTGTLQYLPQIVTTISKNEFGALSLETLLMQCPGSFIFVYSLSLQPGANWTSWISFLICGSCQFILICLYFIQKTGRRDGYVSLPADEQFVVENDQQTTEEQPFVEEEQFFIEEEQHEKPIVEDNQFVDEKGVQVQLQLDTPLLNPDSSHSQETHFFSE